MLDDISSTAMRERAQYWRLRAKLEKNATSRAQFLETAAILLREAGAPHDAGETPNSRGTRFSPQQLGDIIAAP